MVATQDVVLVSSADEKRRRSITSALRARWPVRTASDSRAIDASLDASIGVVVIDSDTLDRAATALQAGDAERTFYQVLCLGHSNHSLREQADAVLDSDVSREPLQTAVERLQARARYDRLLTTFYELASVEDGLDGASKRASAREEELVAVKRELDEVAAQLDDADAFDVALTAHGDDDHSSST